MPALDGATGAVVTVGDLIHPSPLPPLTIDAARAAVQLHTMPASTPWHLPLAQKLPVIKEAVDCLGAQLDLIAALLGAVTLHAEELRTAALSYQRAHGRWMGQWPDRFAPEEGVLQLARSSVSQCYGVDFLVPLAIERAATGDVSSAEDLHMLYQRQEVAHPSGLGSVTDGPRRELGGLLVAEMGPVDAHPAGAGYRFRIEGAPDRTGMKDASWAHPLDPHHNIQLAAALSLLNWEFLADGPIGYLRYLGREARP